MDSVDLNAVNTGLAQLLGGLAEGVDHLLDLLNGQGAGGNILCPAVGDLGGSGAAVLNVNDGAGDLVEQVVLMQNGHPAVDSHGAAHTGSQLNKQLCTGLVELNHVLLELLEHKVVLIQPLSAGDTKLVFDTLHTGQDKANAVLCAVKQEVSSLLVEMVGLQPTEKGGAAHGGLD